MKKTWTPSRLDKLRAIERALARCGDATATVEAALDDTRKEIEIERRARKAARSQEACAGHNRKHLAALVAARTKLTVASGLAKEATVAIASTGLLPVEVREELQEIAAAIDGYVQSRITSTIEHVP